MSSFKEKIIHVAQIHTQNQGRQYLLLIQKEPYHYIWFSLDSHKIKHETTVWGATPEDAILAAYKAWEYEQFQTLRCGFRFTLPERDEVGTNALFHQMVSSYDSSSGIYFDDEVGCNCIVQNASNEARSFWKYLKEA